jgi:arylsulfatase A-like enzyme
MLKEEGYATGVFGKWHVGMDYDHHPLQRGFDEFYGFLGRGAHDYFNLKMEGTAEHNWIYRNNTPIDDEGYLTINLANEAVSFIERHKDEPFFCYLPFNAVHYPMHALQGYIDHYDTGDPNRDILMGMLECMDGGIGEVLDALKRTGVEDNTMVFFYSDNGGATKNFSNNGVLRGFKHSTYEGGIHVPFIVKWPGKIAAGTVCDEPIISLDIFPTVVNAVGAELPSDRTYDGKDMMPALLGELTEPLHEVLFWDGNEGKWAVRAGKWKLLSDKGPVELYDLDADLSETMDLAASNPTKVAELQAMYDAWDAQNAEQI